jgi:hypothetical protein
MIGSLGDFARVMAAGTEVPEVFYFATALTLFGNFCSGALTANVAVDADPRLYTILLGDSYLVKKSTALKRCVAFFEALWREPEFPSRPNTLWGAGSAEGLARTLQENSHLILLYDELRSFIDKTKATGAVLLPMVTSLFEGRNWDNPTKKKSSVNVRDAHLSIASCCTVETYAEMWTPDALNIGLPNRLFVVLAECADRVAWPSHPDNIKLETIRERIRQQLGACSRRLEITPDAKQLWEEWYTAVPHTIHARRLDTIGFRLLEILALTTNKTCIDADVMNATLAILNYELAVRTFTDPFNAATLVARMEGKIRRVLSTKGPCNDRTLRQKVHSERDGLWCYKTARQNLIEFGYIRLNGKTGFYEEVPQT